MERAVGKNEKLESFKMESLKLESLKLESLKLESLMLESFCLSWKEPSEVGKNRSNFERIERSWKFSPRWFK